MTVAPMACYPAWRVDVNHDDRGIWVHLRLCMSCGHVGCCDESKNRHATKHGQATGHPIIKSFEPGEDWGWCYVDQLVLDAATWPVRGPVAHSV